MFHFIQLKGNWRKKMNGISLINQVRSRMLPYTSQIAEEACFFQLSYLEQGKTTCLSCMVKHLYFYGHSQLLVCWFAAHNLLTRSLAIGFMMEICRQTLICADNCYFFSSGNIEPFWTYQNFSFWDDAHVHPPPPINGQSIK